MTERTRPRAPARRFRKTFRKLLAEYDDDIPTLTKVVDAAGNVVGVKANFLEAALLAVRMALEVERYHEHYILMYDPDLPRGHLRVVLAHGQDGLPLDKQKDAVEGRCVRARLGGGGLGGGARARELQPLTSLRTRPARATRSIALRAATCAARRTAPSCRSTRSSS